jgi:hypothetical protein
MSTTSVPPSTASSSPDLTSAMKGWASGHLEIVLPICAVAGAAAGAYLVGIFNATKTAALASSYAIPSDFLSSDPLSNLLWVAIGSLYALAIAYFGLVTFNAMSVSSFRTLMAWAFFLLGIAIPPYTPLTIWMFKVIFIGTVLVLGAGIIWTYRVMRLVFRKQVPPVQNWRQPRWIPGKLWEPLVRDLATVQQSGKRVVDYALEVVTWIGLVVIVTVIATTLIGFGGRWMGEAIAKQPESAWIMDGTQGSQRPVVVFRTTDYWLERPVQERGSQDGQRQFTPVGPVVIHSYDEGPLRLVHERDFGIITQ